MSESRRSSRSRKPIDYASAGGPDVDSDDDFATATPPQPKISRLSRAKKNGKLIENKNHILEKSQVERNEVEDIHVEGVQQPIENNSDNQIMNDSSDDLSPSMVTTEQTETESGDRVVDTKQTLSLTNDSKNEKSKDADYKVDEDDSTDDVEDEDLSADDCADSDSDYEISKVKITKSKATPKNKDNSPSKPKPRFRATAVSVITKETAKQVTVKTDQKKAQKSSERDSGTNSYTNPGHATRKPAWNPPGAAGSDSSAGKLTSPTAGVTGLRLGLSKSVRHKPLHPNMNTSN